MEINSPETAPDYGAGNLREGKLNVKVLLQGEEGSLNNYRLSMETAEESWATPRHRHNFDQVRFPIAGLIEYGKDISLPPGTVGYFPESIHYGPQIRPDKSVSLTLQLGGASGNGFMSPRERRAGFDALLKKGKFEKGAFTYIDNKGQRHNQDAYEAIWEYIRGRELVYPKPRYAGLIKMDPASCDWIPDENARGVFYKRLGTFTERGLEVCMVRIDNGAVFAIPKRRAPQILFVAKGSLSTGGKTYETQTAFGVRTDEGPIEFQGVDNAEVLFVRLPIFADARASDRSGVKAAAE